MRSKRFLNTRIRISAMSRRCHPDGIPDSRAYWFHCHVSTTHSSQFVASPVGSLINTSLPYRAANCALCYTYNLTIFMGASSFGGQGKIPFISDRKLNTLWCYDEFIHHFQRRSSRRWTEVRSLRFKSTNLFKTPPNACE